MRFCHSLKAVLIDNSDEDNTHAVRCTSSVLKHLLTVFVKKKNNPEVLLLTQDRRHWGL